MDNTFFQSFYSPANKDYRDLRYTHEGSEMIRIADLALANTFAFDLADDLIKQYEPIAFSEGISWDFQPGDDPEFVWQLNRHRFLLCLAQAYQLTGAEKYAEGFVRLTKDFMAKEVAYIGREKTTWRILELGIRSENWLKGLYLLAESPQITRPYLQEVRSFLKAQAKVIVDEAGPYNFAGNWGVLEHHGSFLTGLLLPEDEDTLRFREVSLAILVKSAMIQVMTDGMHIEQSPMYHHEVLRCYLEVIYFGELAGLHIPTAFKERVKKMAWASLYSLKPNQETFAGGDSDQMPMGPILELAAVVFTESAFKKGEVLSFANQWLPQVAESYHQIQGQVPAKTTIDFYDSGHCYFRSDWSETADLLHFNSGNLGLSHGHGDLLHLDWVVGGENILVDSGRYTYVAKPERLRMKDLAAHNTILIDGVEPYQWQGAWQSETYHDQFRTPLRQEAGFSYIEAGHTGYLSLPDPVLVTRRVLQLNEGLFLIMDLCRTKGAHHYQQFFHFDAKGELLLQGDRGIFHNGAAQAGVIFDPQADIQLLETAQSYYYNQKEGNQTVVVARNGEGQQLFVTLLASGELTGTTIKRGPLSYFRRKEQLPQTFGEGLTITHQERTYRVIATTGEMPGPIDLLSYEGCSGLGRIIVFDEEEQVGGRVLSW